MLLVAALAAPLDDRLLHGADIWAKPMKFGFSFAVHTATLVWLAMLLDDGTRQGRWVGLSLVGASVAAVIEVMIVSLQAARGRASHFNAETVVDSFLYYQVMGSAALVVVAATFVLGALVLRSARTSVGQGLSFGAAVGAMLGSVATLITAGVMAAGVIDGPGHWVGGIRSDTKGIPVFGWATQGGDLRVPHFFATHLIQALPAAGFLADRLGARRPGLVVLGAAVLGMAIALFTFVQALSGQPFVGPLW
jgi:hypothetical protein